LAFICTLACKKYYLPVVIEQNHYQPSKAIEKASNGPGNVMELLWIFGEQRVGTLLCTA